MVLVDANMLLDVLTNDPVWAAWSQGKLERAAAEGLAINPIIHAELAPAFQTADEHSQRTDRLAGATTSTTLRSRLARSTSLRHLPPARRNTDLATTGFFHRCARRIVRTETANPRCGKVSNLLSIGDIDFATLIGRPRSRLTKGYLRT